VLQQPAKPTLLTKIATVFPEANSGSGTGSGTVQFTATKAAATALTRASGSLIRVAADESNNGDKSMYLDNGTSLEFQYTII
jgi:hypothetical protein